MFKNICSKSFNLRTLPTVKASLNVQKTSILHKYPTVKKQVISTPYSPQRQASQWSLKRQYSTQPEERKGRLNDKEIAIELYLEESSFSDQKPWIKEWTIDESEAERPQLLKPFMVFVGVGLLSFTLAAFMTVRKTGKTVQYLSDHPEHKKGLKMETDYYLKNVFSIWGSVEESNMIALDESKRSQKYLAMERRWQDLCDLLPDSFKGSLSVVKDYIPKGYSVTLPFLALSSVAFVGFKFSRTRIMKKYIPLAFIRRNFMHTPTINRLHTLITSNFVYSSTSSFFVYSGLIFYLGGQYFSNPRFFRDINGKPLHTAETRAPYHFLAFCITAGAFSRFSSQVFSRILLSRASTKFGPKIAKQLIGRIPTCGPQGIVFALMAMPAYSGIVSGEFAEQRPLLNTACIFSFMIHGMFFTSCIVEARMQGFINVATFAGGQIFGLLYFQFGNAFWESLKQVFYVRDQYLSTKSPLSMVLLPPTLIDYIKMYVFLESEKAESKEETKERNVSWLGFLSLKLES